MKIIAKNKRAYFDYHVLDNWEAGLVLTGAEVKSVKAGHINLKGSYVSLIDIVPKIVNCHIASYKHAKSAQKDYDPMRPRRLLLNKKEVSSLIGLLQQKGLTLLPLSVYTKNGFVKVELGLCRGKKKHDKREILKKKATDREIAQTIRNKTSQ
ncbi:SsrA-binding protein SmpB [Patescibacteria group bacterium]|nr:SsrA-binding protein SmpB [Patescibacteria group bacterium]MBU1952487.1 SsrA-binding protein SmpB [Patescibacteria group bacterium]MBU2235965.1 SsrA-binding protein SmpB [Patescibacteria group bacterium]